MLRRIDKSQALVFDPELDARRAELTYASDSEPGIRRRKTGRGFTYVAPDGSRVTDAVLRARIRRLAIPPAWEDVWISTRSDGHIQATGRDQRGRKQYRYHPEWMSLRDETKFSSLLAFAGALPKLRQQVNSDLSRRGVPMERAVASVVWLLDRTMIRIGNVAYRRQNNSFGLTTLENRHISIEGASLRFSFVGKSGQEWKLNVSDRRIARIIRAIQELPGQHLFQYLDHEGTRRPVHSHDVNNYIRMHAGKGFSSKHFRTWGATCAAAMLLSGEETPASKRMLASRLNKTIDLVARRLRNTRAVCRQCYIHPAVIESWQEGRLVPEMAEIRRRHRRVLKGFDEEESAVLRWLRMNLEV